MSKRKKGKTMVSLKKTEIPETPQYQEINSNTEVEFISEGIGFEVGDIVKFENLNKGEEEMNRKIRNKRNHNEKIMNSREKEYKNISDKITQKGEEKMENNYAAMNNNDIKEENKYVTKEELTKIIKEVLQKEIKGEEDLPNPQPQVEIIDEVDVEEDLDKENKEEEEVVINKIDNKIKAKTLIKGVAVFAGSICLGYFVGKMAKGTVEGIQKEAIESASIVKEFI